MRIWLSESELERLIGLKNAKKFINKYGGQRIYIPSKSHDTHKLARLVGVQGMSALCASYPSQYIELPSTKKFQRAKDRILTLLEKGEHSKVEIAIKVGVSIRYVEQVASSVP